MTNITGSNTQSEEESLYSRQLLVFGPQSHQKLKESKVLVIGIDGLSQEIAKNLVLAGLNVDVLEFQAKNEDPIKSNVFTEWECLTAYYGTPGEKKTNIVGKLRELNKYSKVRDVRINGLEQIIFNGKYEEMDAVLADLKQYSLLICSNIPMPLKFTDFCHENRVKLIITEQKGLSGYIVSDLGVFKSHDVNGENNKIGSVAKILPEESEENKTEEKSEKLSENGQISLLVHTVERHNLESDDIVNLSNNEYKITVKSPFTFSILSKHVIEADTFEEVKQPRTFNFKSIRENIKNEHSQVIKFYSALAQFYEKNGRIPQEYSTEDANQMEKIFLNENEGKKEDLVSLQQFSYTCAAQFQPIISVIGGYVAQEAMKCVSERFSPLEEVFVYECFDLVYEKESEPSKTTQQNIFRFDSKSALYNSIYRHLYILFLERTIKIFKSKVFLVGAGAIGCEHLKNLYTNISVTDMDSIEESNLNRQFLFRRGDIGEFKSNCAARSINFTRKNWKMNISDEKNENIDTSCDIKSYTVPVNYKTENIFTDSFLEGFDLIALALDNSEAREYMDSRAINLKMVLFDSGTLGTKGHTQVCIPYLTESYGASRDPPEKEIPLCTIRNFPHLIEHCVEWGLAQFNELFSSGAQSEESQNGVSSSGNDTNTENLSEQDKEIQNMQKKINPMNKINKSPPKTAEQAIHYAIDLLNFYFSSTISDLISLFPKDHVTDDGVAFWEPPKKYPRILETRFDEEAVEQDTKESINLFISSCAKLLAETWQVDTKNTDWNAEILKIRSQNDKMPQSGPNEDVPAKLPLVFEKDNDSNNHVNFVYAASNLRAYNYKIKNTSRLEVKRLAGKIIPAIATTTAVISGLSCIEMYRFILNKEFVFSKPVDSKSSSSDSALFTLDSLKFKPVVPFLNSFINLALPFVTFSEPMKPSELTCDLFNYKFDLWDETRVKNCTIRDIVNLCTGEGKISAETQSKDLDGCLRQHKVDMISVNDQIVYMSWDNAKYEHHMDQKIVKPGEKKKRLDLLFEQDCLECMAMWIYE